MSGKTPQTSSFKELKLAPELLSTLENLGYEAPSPVQAQAIPHLLNVFVLVSPHPPIQRFARDTTLLSAVPAAVRLLAATPRGDAADDDDERRPW